MPIERAVTTHNMLSVRVSMLIFKVSIRVLVRMPAGVRSSVTIVYTCCAY